MLEKEYIERDAVIELAKSNKTVCSCLADIVDVMQIVNDIPTADVQSVKHGEWIAKSMRKPNYNYGVPYDNYICSQCAYKLSNNGLVGRYNYCPNCGAKMDGDDTYDKPT